MIQKDIPPKPPRGMTSGVAVIVTGVLKVIKEWIEIRFFFSWILWIHWPIKDAYLLWFSKKRQLITQFKLVLEARKGTRYRFISLGAFKQLLQKYKLNIFIHARNSLLLPFQSRSAHSTQKMDSDRMAFPYITHIFMIIERFRTFLDSREALFPKHHTHLHCWYSPPTAHLSSGLVYPPYFEKSVLIEYWSLQ